MNWQALLKARALLKALNYEPTPQNVEKVYQIDDKFTLNGKDYQVFTQDEIIEELAIKVLSEPKRLPASFLALFLSKIHDEFNVVQELSQILRESTHPKSNYVILKLIENDLFVKEHILELIEHNGIDGFFYGDKVYQTNFQTQDYVIIERLCP